MISNSNSTGKNYTQLNGAIAACLSVAIYFGRPNTTSVESLIVGMYISHPSTEFKKQFKYGSTQCSAGFRNEY